MTARITITASTVNKIIFLAAQPQMKEEEHEKSELHRWTRADRASSVLDVAVQVDGNTRRAAPPEAGSSVGRGWVTRGSAGTQGC